MEWPPGSKKIRQFPEVDRGGWFALALARMKILRVKAPYWKNYSRHCRRADV